MNVSKKSFVEKMPENLVVGSFKLCESSSAVQISFQLAQLVKAFGKDPVRLALAVDPEHLMSFDPIERHVGNLKSSFGILEVDKCFVLIYGA